jgi:hypothetical protein
MRLEIVGIGDAASYRMIRKSLAEQVIFEQRLEGSEGWAGGEQAKNRE